jgi:hypothetical protein
MKRLLLLFPIVLILICLIPIGDAHAATSQDISIIAYGYIIEPPGGFTYTYISDYELGLSWTPGNGSINTMVRVGYGSFPANQSDGFLVYYGDNTSCIDTNYNMFWDQIPFYVAWSEDQFGEFSLISASQEVNIMTQSAIFFGILALASVATFFSFKSPIILFRIGAAVGFVTLLLFVVTSDRAMTITNPWVVSLFLTIFCMVIAILMMYMGREINQYGQLMKKAKDERSNEQKRQDAYRDKLKTVTGRGNYMAARRGRRRM